MIINKIGCWNIRGINGFKKQKYVRDWIKNNKLSLFSLIETKVKLARLHSVQDGLALGDWRIISNATGDVPARIIIGWDPGIYDVLCVHSDEQLMTCRVSAFHQSFEVLVTFVYGHNAPADRNNMWDYIKHHCGNFRLQSWILMGDFNASLKLTDCTGGDTNWGAHKNDFGICMQQS